MDKLQRIPESRLIDIKNVTGQQVFRLTQRQTKIGRSAGNDFIILKSTISGSHALIEYRENGFYLSDLDSTNKTQVNNHILKPHTPIKLQDGDEITFDVYQFIFVSEKRQPAGDLPEEGDNGDQRPERATPVKPSPLKASEPPEPVVRKIGRYEAFVKLGKGGFGSVWKARDPNGDIVAIKLLNPENLEDERAVRKFFHEAIILSNLNHPNITRFIDFFPKDENYVIVMDYVEGTDLKALLHKHKGPLPFDLACRIAGQVLDAFQFAYEKGVIHRDIKPENIILDTGGNTRIMDFGIAKMSSAATQKTAFSMISPLYTPPERFDRSSKVDVRSDIYSLGLVFYEIFTGKHPIDETNPSKVIFAHINKFFDPPEQFADIPHGMSQAILKALEKNPAERFQDFAEFKEALLGRDGKSTIEQGAATDRRPAPEAGQLDLSEQPGQGKAAQPGPASIIDVSPEYFQVGVAVLNLFTETLKSHLKKGARFSITQAGTTLKLAIETADGERHHIEKNMRQILDAARRKRR